MCISMILGVGDLDKLEFFNQLHGNLGACPWGRQVQVGLYVLVEGAHLQGEAIDSGDPPYFTSCMFHDCI